MSIEEISAANAAIKVAQGTYLLDVRNDDEWEAGHATDAHYVSLAQLPDRLEELPNDNEIIVICRSGARSLKAAKLLTARGFSAANLTGGMQSWAASGLPVVNASGAPGEVI